MRTPYFPLHVADYEAKTAHLTIEEDGAYMRLLRLIISANMGRKR